MSDKLEKAYAEWQAAETDYAKALKHTLSGDRSKITVKVARELMALRSRADNRMDRFFKKALT